jgi:ceramide glucosyltransferase
MTELVWAVLTGLALLGLVATAASIVQGLRMEDLVRRAMRTAFGAFLPRVVIVLPVRGLDPGFEENLRAILSQSYPHFRILVMADGADDPAAVRALEIGRATPGIPLVVAVSQPTHLPGKVNALRSSFAHLASEDEVVVFADSDIRPAPDWLRQLVQPLADATVGVATGFRWYVPPRPTFWSLVRAEWNAVSANVLFDPLRAFAWGGSCAVRQADLSRLRLEERWRDVLSDDLILTQAVRQAGLRIAYAPAALVPTLEGATRSTCMEWCLRQMSMATLYHPVVRRYAAAAFAIFDGSVVLGLVCLWLVFVWGPFFVVPAVIFLAPLPVAPAKAHLRRKALLSVAPSVAKAWRVSRWKAAAAAIVVPWVMAWGLMRTRHPVAVTWRGRRYDVTDPVRIRLLESEEPSRLRPLGETG